MIFGPYPSCLLKLSMVCDCEALKFHGGMTS